MLLRKKLIVFFATGRSSWCCGIPCLLNGLDDSLCRETDFLLKRSDFMGFAAFEGVTEEFNCPTVLNPGAQKRTSGSGVVWSSGGTSGSGSLVETKNRVVGRADSVESNSASPSWLERLDVKHGVYSDTSTAFRNALDEIVDEEGSADDVLELDEADGAGVLSSSSAAEQRGGTSVTQIRHRTARGADSVVPTGGSVPDLPWTPNSYFPPLLQPNATTDENKCFSVLNPKDQANNWVQLDFRREIPVTGVVTQACGEGWAERFEMQYWNEEVQKFEAIEQARPYNPAKGASLLGTNFSTNYGLQNLTALRMTPADLELVGITAFPKGLGPVGFDRGDFRHLYANGFSTICTVWE